MLVRCSEMKCVRARKRQMIAVGLLLVCSGRGWSRGAQIYSGIKRAAEGALMHDL